MQSVDDRPAVTSRRLSALPWYPIALIVTLVATILGILGLTHLPAPGASPAAQSARVSGQGLAPSTAPLLPGEKLWGAWPNYLFGTNDTQNWDPQHSLETEPAIQQELKADHFPFIRAWFFQKSLIDGSPVTDAEQMTRIQAVHNSGMTCLAELPTGNTMAYDEHIVTMLKGKCAFYEFMNEPDIEGVHSDAYIAAWKTEIPKLRAIDPAAKFGGPADYNNQGNECSYSITGGSECFLQKVMKGMAASGVLPDFITFHWYPCWQEGAASCLAKADSYAEVTTTVRGWVRQYFHKDLPVGITEWNPDPSAPMPDYTKDATWMTQYTIRALRSMQSAGLSFANQLDLANAGGYLTDDMVDIYHNGAPKPQYLAMKALIASAMSGKGIAMTPGPQTPQTPSATSTASAGAAPPSATAVPGAKVFADGFESGNTSAWSKVSAAAGDSATVTSSGAHQGSYALAINKAVGSGDVFARKALATGLTTLDLSFALRLDHPTGHGELQFAELLSGQQGQYFIGGLYLSYNAATSEEQLYYLDGQYKWHACSSAPSYGVWHVYDLRLVVEDVATGSLSLTLDGANICSASSIATAQAGQTAITAFALGSASSDPTTGMSMLLDDVRLTA
ncbi:MAG TPA: hypothetical protein VF812_14465 [Ktedonobacterales bacterium]